MAAKFKDIGQSATTPFQNIGAALAGSAKGFALNTLAAVAMGGSIKQVMKQMTATVLGQIASIAGVESVKDFALGLEALGVISLTGNPSAGVAAGHLFAASAAWAGLAVGAAVAGGAISKRGNGGGGAGGSASAGAQYQAPFNQDPRQLAVARGKPFDKDGPSTRKTVYDTSGGQLAVLQSVAEQINEGYSKLAQSMDQHTQVTLQLHDKIASMSAHEVIVAGASDHRAVAAIGQALQDNINAFITVSQQEDQR